MKIKQNTRAYFLTWFDSKLGVKLILSLIQYFQKDIFCFLKSFENVVMSFSHGPLQLKSIFLLQKLKTIICNYNSDR